MDPAEQLSWWVKEQLIGTIEIQESYKLRRKHLQCVLGMDKNLGWEALAK